MKNDIIHYLKTDRSLLGGRNLYNKLPNKNLALQQTFSRFSDTKANKAKLHYELCKAAGIPERKLNIILNQPVKKDLADIQFVAEKETPEVKDLSPKEQLLAFTTEGAKFHPAKALAKSLNIKPVGKKGEDLYKALEAAKVIAISEQVTALPIQIKAAVKLRDQFPFLRNESCPDSLKLLVNDLITSYNIFKEAQPKLHELLPQAESAALGDFVLEKYIDNKEAWAELEHFKTTNTILGVHPLFERLALKEEITAMSTLNLTKKIKTLEINIGKNKTKENTDLVARDEDLLVHAKGILEKR